MAAQEVRATSRLANDAWEGLLAAHTSLMKRFAAEDIWHDLSMREYDVLYTLAKCDGPVRLSELNDQVLLSQPALSRMVDRLVSRELVQRVPDDADGRSVRLALTDAGREQQRRVGGRHGAGVAHAMRSRLTGHELGELERLCQKLTGDTATVDQTRSKEDSTT